MKNAAYAVYWILVGIWLAVLAGFTIEAKREEGGSMPLAMPMGMGVLIGGLFGFLLLHILIRKIWGAK